VALRAVANAWVFSCLVPDRHEIAEPWFERGGVELVVGCFSTALMTASRLYGLPVARLGTDLLLERLSPFQNGNRIPAIIVDALVPELPSLVASEPEPGKSLEIDIDALVVAVGYRCSRLGWQTGAPRRWRSSPIITKAIHATSLVDG
jgi:hypothetical protein